MQIKNSRVGDGFLISLFEFLLFMDLASWVLSLPCLSQSNLETNSCQY
jgi:hypothetical protein